ncbi:hypothetical protein J6590_034665 [Homalodisca vitripennis]|nr:hypothetical protein J6590_034665 [Homalodisca vitripennis]
MLGEVRAKKPSLIHNLGTRQVTSEPQPMAGWDVGHSPATMARPLFSAGTGTCKAVNRRQKCHQPLNVLLVNPRRFQVNAFSQPVSSCNPVRGDPLSAHTHICIPWPTSSGNVFRDFAFYSRAMLDVGVRKARNTCLRLMSPWLLLLLQKRARTVLEIAMNSNGRLLPTGNL